MYVHICVCIMYVQGSVLHNYIMCAYFCMCVVIPSFFCSYYLYSISHPNKTGVPVYDLSKDPEAIVDINDENLTPVQLLIERVIMKVFNHYSIPLNVADSVRTTFRSKLWRMGKKLSTLGGTNREEQLRRWKASIWSLKIDSNEVLRQLRKRTLQTEHQLEYEISKRRRAEEEVKSLKSEVKKLEKTRDKNSETRTSKTRGRSKKPWGSYSRQHQSVIKTGLANDIKKQHVPSIINIFSLFQWNYSTEILERRNV